MPTLLELVSTALPIQKRRGKDAWFLCPFHQDKRPSFHVRFWRGKQRFNCFACGARGDAADWLIQTQGLSYPEAKRLLGDPAKPDPAIIRQRQREYLRRQTLNTYHDRNPDCCLPDWLIAT